MLMILDGYFIPILANQPTISLNDGTSASMLVTMRLTQFATVYQAPFSFSQRPAIRITGWWFEPLWKILVNWDDYSQYMGK